MTEIKKAQQATKAIRNAGEVLNMSILTLNKHRYKLKVLCFKNRHKTIYLTLCIIPHITKSRLISIANEKRPVQNSIKFEPTLCKADFLNGT